MEEITKLNYPKLFILNENDNTKISKSLDSLDEKEAIKEYKWKIVSTVTEEHKDDKIYTLIQYKEKKLGWIELNSSIQIFRFEPKIYRFIDNDFIVSDINKKILINKNFKEDLSNKLLTVHSEIEYQGKKLLGIFIKNEFYGFHDAKYFEEIIATNIIIPKEELHNKIFYKVSDLKKPINNPIEINNPKIVSIFKFNRIGKIKMNKVDYCWISLDGLDEYIHDIKPVNTFKSDIQKHLDDIIFAINRERRQSKEIVKTVLNANNYIKSRKAKAKDSKIKTLQSSFNRANSKLERLETHNKMLVEKKESLEETVLELKHENHKLTKELKLNMKRLNQQKDYNYRLEQQKEKYKARMVLVEEKLKK